MTSINTNQSAMVALETMRGINNKLSTLNDQISTGKAVNSAKDNASIWSIAKTMDSDVMSFKAVSDSLSLAGSTIGVARTASESITDLLIEVKSLVTQSSNKNTDDRTKIAADITNLTNQITDIVDAAQFNGVNLINDTTAVNYLSSFNRDAAGGVATDTIAVSRQDLRIGSAGTVVNGDLTQTGNEVAGFSAGGAIDASLGALTGQVALSFASGSTVSEGDNFSIDVNGQTATYVANATDGIEQVITELAGALGAGSGISNASAVDNSGTWELQVDVANGTGSFTATVDSAEATVTGAQTAGGLAALSTLSVVDETATTAALDSIETLIGVATDASAAFGTAERRIEIQDEFVTNLTDSLKLGIGTLTDADLSAASAELSALQVQQQLGLQSLSIANQAPQTILALFQ